MCIEFDPSKDAANLRKHGVSLAEAGRIDWGRSLVSEDRRRDYGERRHVSIGPIGRRLYVVVYVERGDRRRIVSLRKANAREFKLYEEASEADSADS